MKKAILSLAVLMVSGSLLHADFTERRLEHAITSATKSGKLIAFAFYQDYALPNCPKCVTRTDANNKALKASIPRSDVVLIEIEPGDKNIDKVPACVGAKEKAPRLVITDAKAENVIVKVGGAPDREKAKEIRTLVEKARAGS